MNAMPWPLKVDAYLWRIYIRLSACYVEQALAEASGLNEMPLRASSNREVTMWISDAWLVCHPCEEARHSSAMPMTRLIEMVSLSKRELESPRAKLVICRRQGGTLSRMLNYISGWANISHRRPEPVTVVSWNRIERMGKSTSYSACNNWLQKQLCRGL